MALTANVNVAKTLTAIVATNAKTITTTSPSARDAIAILRVLPVHSVVVVVYLLANSANVKNAWKDVSAMSVKNCSGIFKPIILMDAKVY